MSPARTRKTTATQPDSIENPSEREVALPRADDVADAQAADTMATGDGTASADSLDERIRQRAYELYCSRGQSDGDPIQDWLEAERQLRSAHSASEGAAPRALEAFGDESPTEALR